MQVEDLLNAYSSEEIIQVLEPLLTEERKKRIHEVLGKRVGSVQVALEAPADIHNALAVTRSGEAMGVYHFHLVDAQLVKGRGKATMRGSSRWIHLHQHQNVQDFKREISGFVLAGAALEGDLTLEELPTDRPLCLFFGNERKGLSKKAVEACDILYRIPMVGMVESFNLSVSAAISLYEVMKSKKGGDLDLEDQLAEKARYYVRSLGIKIANDILQRSR